MSVLWTHLTVVVILVLASTTQPAFSHTISASSRSDVLVYAATPGGIMAAVAAARSGMKVTLLCTHGHVGGVVAGGLGKTDTGNTNVIGGLAHEFFLRNARYYNPSATSPAYDLEPHVAEAIFDEMLHEARVNVLFNCSVAQASMITTQDGSKAIGSITLTNGQTFEAAAFVDASYEGDLLAQAGVSFTVGREAISQYNESLAGARIDQHQSHEFDVAISPLDDHGRPLPFVQPNSPGTFGQGDKKVQSYNFRLCVTQNKTNMVPFSKPPDYDPAQWELARRYFAQKPPSSSALPSCNTRATQNGKYDLNNCGAISTDAIGMSWAYPTANYTHREQIWQQHKSYTQGLLWFLSQDPSLPNSVHKTMATWGLCKDEFVDSDNWPFQLYVREGRRMLGQQVFTQNTPSESKGHDITPHAVGMGSYNFDMHNAERYVCNDTSKCTMLSKLPYAWNEGDVEVNPGEYQIPFEILTPNRSECSNLIVPVALSASHVGYGTLRLEPQFMILGHSSGVATALAVNSSSAIQDVDLNKLTALLKEQGQILSLPPPPPPPPPAPPSSCQFQTGRDYNHTQTNFPAKTQQECCNICGATEGCKYAVFRFQGPSANTCWIGHDMSSYQVKEGVTACVLSKLSSHMKMP